VLLSLTTQRPTYVRDEACGPERNGIADAFVDKLRAKLSPP
jgi:hypothetical protein